MIPALSIRQPWAWLIVHGFKDIENRDWPTNFRGRLLVHAGQTMAHRYYDETCEVLLRMGLLPASMPAYEDLPRGGLVGWTHVTDCHQHHPSPWKQDGSHGFVLRDSRPISFVPLKGRLGFFNVPKEAIRE
jgi:hypothetical protein